MQTKKYRAKILEPLLTVIFLSLVFLGLIGLSYLLMTAEEGMGYLGYIMPFVIVIMALSIIVANLLYLRSVLMGVTNKPMLVLSEEGIINNTQLSFSGRLISWDDIKDLSIQDIKVAETYVEDSWGSIKAKKIYSKFIVILLRENNQIFPPQKEQAFVVKLLRAFDTNTRTSARINSKLVKADLCELENTLMTFKAHYDKHRT